MKRKSLRFQMLGTILIVLLLFFVTTVVFTAVEMQSLEDNTQERYDEYVDLYNDLPETPDETAMERFEQTVEMIKISGKKIIESIVLGAVIAFALAVVIASWRTKKLLEPMHHLREEMKAVGQGNLTKEVTVEADNEIAELADEFNAMLAALRRYMDDLQRTTSDKERMSAELSVMRQIQKDMLPSRYPARGDMQLYAAVWPLSEGGGDYYDFFWADRDHLTITVGDVTDTGIMATLYAVLAQTFMRSFGKMGYTPSRILAETNNQLSEKNEFGMNVAAMTAVIDLSMGELTYSSAGGEAFLWKHAGGDAEPIDFGEVTIPLGNMENVPYHNKKIRLAQGDMLIFYTKGISQAHNAKGERYTVQRIADYINSELRQKFDLAEMGEDIRQDALDFIGDVRQEDDGIIVMFRYMG